MSYNIWHIVEMRTYDVQWAIPILHGFLPVVEDFFAARMWWVRRRLCGRFILLHLSDLRVLQKTNDVPWGPLRGCGGEREDPEGAVAHLPEGLAGGDDVRRALEVSVAEPAQECRVDVGDELQAIQR